jgi:hypothetical protein
MLKEQKKQDDLKVLLEGQESEAVQACCTIYIAKGSR